MLALCQIILELGKYLINNIEHSVLLLNNEKYNRIITDPNMNLNKVKAILHNKVINTFLNKYIKFIALER